MFEGGFGEYGFYGLMFGFDGMIYVVIGNYILLMEIYSDISFY